MCFTKFLFCFLLSFLKYLNKVKPAPAREVEVVCFRPTEEEHKNHRKKEQIGETFAAHKLRPASLFELLALVPDDRDRDARTAFVQEFGEYAFLFAHAHHNTTWLGNQPAYLAIERGFIRHCSVGILCAAAASWYIGYRLVKEPKPPAA